MRKAIISFSISLFSLVGCSLCEEAGGLSDGEIYVEFSLSAPTSKSSMDVNEDQVSDINIYAYCDGMLCGEIYSDDIENGVGMGLNMGCTYNIYALANVGEVAVPADESALDTLSCEFFSIEDFAGRGLPLVGTTQVSPTPTQNSAVISLTRLVAKVNFKVDSRELGGMTVNSIRIMQSPLDVRPFSGQSAATKVDNGDYASESDVAQVNAGNEATFYVLENCRGILLEGNDDPWNKVPDSLGDIAGLCTYIEVEVDFDGSYGISGSAVYRFFLGQDSTSDFNVFRNTESTVTLKVTSDGLDHLSWRIDNSDISYGDIKFVMSEIEYAGQWGTIEFPDASAEHPVTVSFVGGNESITIPSSSSCHLGEPGDAADLAVYLASTTTPTLHVCLGETKTLTVTQDLLTETIEIPVNTGLSWVGATDNGYVKDGGEIVVNEDGTDCEVRVYLWDVDKERIVSPSSLEANEEVRAYLDAYFEKANISNVRSHIYWYYDLDVLIIDSEGTRFQTADYSDLKYYCALEDEEYLYTFHLYGLSADGTEANTATMALSQNYLSAWIEVTVRINPAFPNQRHIGETYNYVLALAGTEEAAQGNTSTLSLHQSSEGTTRATWQIARGSKYEDGDSEKEFDDLTTKETKALVSARSSGQDIILTYTAPTAAADYEFVAGGTYHLRGTVANPHSGREITGDYSVDVVLYLVVGEEVSFYEEEDSGGDLLRYMNVSYLPAVSRCGADDETFRELWRRDLNWCDIKPEFLDATQAWGVEMMSGIAVPDNVIGGSDSIDNIDGDPELFKRVNAFVKEKLETLGHDFKFYDSSSGEYLVEVKGSGGYTLFEAHRLQDVVSGYYILEDYYRSYDNY